MPEETLCTACLREHSKFDRARSVFAYDDSSWLLVIEFKHAEKPLQRRFWLAGGHDMSGRGGIVGRCWTDQTGATPSATIICMRLYQAALLATALSRQTDAPLSVDLRVRRRDTKPPDECRRLRGSAMSRALF
jgi:predicted amidophosphoribosyltransferase